MSYELEAGDGTIEVTVHGALDENGNPRKLELDVLILRIFIDEAEKSFPPNVIPEAEAMLLPNYVPGMTLYTASAGMLLELSSKIAREYGYCTPTIANQLWLKFSDIVKELKKNMNTTPESPSGIQESTPPG